MYEHIPKHNSPLMESSDRSFGLVFAAVFLVIALFPLLKGGTLRLWPTIVSGVFLLLALVAPGVLGPVNRLWMTFGKFLHGIVSPIALCIVFYLAVMPTGLLMRLFGKDPLRLRFEPAAKSYWIPREPPGPTGESLNNQF